MAISRSQMPMQVSPSFEEEGGIRYLNGGGTARDPYAGQGSRMLANILGNQMGFRNVPFLGSRLTNLADTGFQRIGRRLQFLPGARQFGNLFNRVGRRANQFTNFRDRLNPASRLINPQSGGLFGLRGRGGPLGFGLLNRTQAPRQTQGTGLFGLRGRGGPLGFGLLNRMQAPRQTSGTGLFGLRGKGGLLGFGLLGGRGTPRQVARQQYGGSPSILGSGAFASSYTPKIGEDVVTGRQDSSTRNVPNYTGTIESGDFDIFDTASEPTVEYSFARAPRGSIIGTSGFASNIPYARISSLGGGGGFGGSGASSGGFGGGFAFKKEHAQDAGG